MSGHRHRSLVDHLREASDEWLLQLLHARPELAHPLPADLEAVAARAHSPNALLRALEQLNQFDLEVLDAIRVLKDQPDGPRAEALPILLGPDVPAVSLEEALTHLRDLALIWPDGPF